jgi:MFS family permease
MNRAERLDDGEYSLREGAASLVGLPGPTSQTLARRPDAAWGSHISESATDPHAQAVSLNGGHGFRSVLRNPLFLRLWLAQLISQTITNAANYGLIVLVAKQTGSNLGSSLAIVAFALPAALFAAPAGVLVDRFDRRTVLWISNALRSLAAFGFVISLLIDSRAFVPVLLLSFFMSTVAQFFSPAEGAAIPTLVQPRELMNALALFNITFTLAQALGLILLGPAIILLVQPICFGTCGVGPTITSTETLFLVVALLYVVCTLLILSIPGVRLRFRRSPAGPATNVGDHQLRSIWAGLLESWRFVRRDRRMVQAVVQLCLGGTVIAIVAAVSPNFVRVFFNRPQTYAALVFFPAGIGLVLGSALVPAAAQRLRYARTVATGIITLGICAVLLPFVREIAEKLVGPGWWQSWVYLGVAMLLIFLVGISLDLINVPAQTLVQEHSPDWMKGRVLALQGMVLNAVTVPSVLLVGVMADRFTLPFALEAVAIVIVVAGLPSVYFATRAGTNREGLPAA